MNHPFFDLWTPRVLGLLRLVSGALLVQHGAQKLFGVLGAKDQPPLMSQAGVGGIIELFGGLLLAVGLLTRPVAFLLSGTMAVAYFQFHAPGGFFPVVNKGELAVIYCFVYLAFAFVGGGPWSLEAALFGRRRASSDSL